MKIGVTDIEANNLYNENLTKFHCAWIVDPNNPTKRKGYRPEDLESYISEMTKNYDILVFHNGVDFDCPALNKLYPSFTSCRIFDTLVLSRMLFPERLTHSLKSWGIELGVLKGDYGDEENAWEEFTEEMYVYCEQDVEVTVKLYLYLCKVAGFDPENPPSVLLNFKR